VGAPPAGPSTTVLPSPWVRRLSRSKPRSNRPCTVTASPLATRPPPSPARPLSPTARPRPSSTTPSLQPAAATPAFIAPAPLAALVVAGLAIGVILHRFVRGQLDGRLDAQITALRAGLEAGILPGSLDAPPYDRPGPGWAWEVRRGSETIRSGSLRGGDIRLS